MTAPQPMGAAERAVMAAGTWVSIPVSEFEALHQLIRALEAERGRLTADLDEALTALAAKAEPAVQHLGAIVARAEAAEREAAGLRGVLGEARAHLHTLAGLDTMGRERAVVIECLPSVAEGLLVKIDTALAATQRAQEARDA